MTPLMTTSGGNTPLSPEELADLLPSLATKEELNEWERDNILLAREWATRDRTSPNDMVSDEYLRKLHLKMFDQTWKWAGQYRQIEKNIGIPFHEIREGLAVLFGDVRYWIENGTFSPDEIAVRFHYRLVAIHPFPNGNGRHARLMADVLVMKLGRPAFTWGSTDLIKPGESRARYLDAIRTADNSDIQPLLEFARL
ncbi:MAG: mobile mystery protein B [Acidobacteriales bacterium]|nr:mobile mystery protein B [Terriglobales bacterium]